MSGRCIIFGVGAIGGIFAARLAGAGEHVALVARGQTLEALRKKGLRLRSATEDICQTLLAVEDLAEIGVNEEDRIFLCTKSQDTAAALEAMRTAVPRGVPVVCAQNGVANEPSVARHFDTVIGAYVYIYGLGLTPGAVETFTSPSAGIVDLGSVTDKGQSVAVELVSRLGRAGFDSLCRNDIMRWKYRKLIANCVNIIRATCSDGRDMTPMDNLARREAEDCLLACGVEVASEIERLQRLEAVMPLATIDGREFPGGSSWQSVQSGKSLETDYLNGEIVRLGAKHGVSVPINSYLLSVAHSISSGRLPGADEVQGHIFTLARL